MRYAIFSGNNYYTGGGWLDFVASGDDKEAILEQAREIYREAREQNHADTWVHVVDLEQLRFVACQPARYNAFDTLKDIPRLVEETK